MVTVDRSLTPADAVVALRSFPRRWRAVPSFSPGTDDADEDRGRRVGPDGMSPLDHLVRATNLLGLFEKAVRDTVSGSEPVLHPAIGDAAARTWPAPQDLTVADALELLDRQASEFAEVVSRVDHEHWLRTATVADGRPVTALDLLREAVADAATDLRAADRR